MQNTDDRGLKSAQDGTIRDQDPASQLLAKYSTLESLRDLSIATRKNSGSVEASEHDSGSDVTTTSPTQTPFHILFLGSSLGNSLRGGDADFLRGLPLRPGSGDTLLLGLDHDNGLAEIEQAHDDLLGISREFVMQGKPPDLVERLDLTPR